ncbi:MAG: 16S rRNA (guanine(527)-N(7))-methyltransferase RsmG [Pseudomonadota bacterium]
MSFAPDQLPNVSRETLDRLNTLATFTKKWTAKINLVAPATVPNIWTRHILDSLQLWQHRPDKCSLWYDLGSGGGYPGLVLAALAAQDNVDASFTLIESDQRKCVFLRQAAAAMGISVSVVPGRVEAFDGPAANVISARAFASIEKTLSISKEFTGSSTVFILPKGKTAAEELEAASESWSFNCDQTISETAPDASILVLSSIKPRNGSEK